MIKRMTAEQALEITDKNKASLEAICMKVYDLIERYAYAGCDYCIYEILPEEKKHIEQVADMLNTDGYTVEYNELDDMLGIYWR